PQTRTELHAWVREHLHLAAALETALLAAIEAVFTRHERLWQESKQEAIQALSTGFADKMTKVKHELSARDATVSSISRYFARFGGDEFCFLIPDLAEYRQAYAIAERFREAVERYDWTIEDRRLAAQPVRVDVGVVCLQLGRVAERRFIARRLASALISQADKLMYEAKGERASHIYLVRVRVENGEVIRISEDESGAPAQAAQNRSTAD